MQNRFAGFLVFCLTLVSFAAPASAQKAGVITRFLAPASITPAGPVRPGVQVVSVPIPANGTAFKVKDTLETVVNGRIRAQLNDASILSLGQNSKLLVMEHEEKAQQSELNLN